MQPGLERLVVVGGATTFNLHGTTLRCHRDLVQHRPRLVDDVRHVK